MRVETEFASWKTHSAMSASTAIDGPGVIVDGNIPAMVYHKWIEDRAQYISVICANSEDEITSRMTLISDTSIDDLENGDFVAEWYQTFKCHASKWRPVIKKKTWTYTSKIQQNSVHRILK